RGNVLDKDSLRPALRGIDVVYHLAGIISIMPGRSEAMRQVNVVGTANVARLAREAGVRRMVYVSSIHALARPPRGIAIDESVAFDPHNAEGEYDQTKAEASLAVLDEVARGLDAVIICPTGIIGPYHLRGGSPMNKRIRKWMRPGWHMTLNGQFDFVDVRDVARCMILAAEKGRRGETYIASGERINVAKLVGLVRENTGHKGVDLLVPFPLALFAATFTPLYSRISKKPVEFTRYALKTLDSNSFIRCDKARRELGYEPRPMSETIRDTVRWFQENPELPSVAAPAARPAPRVASGPAQRAARPRRPRIAVVTGASSGIGSVVAERLAGRGYRVLLVARRRDRMESIAALIAAAGGSSDIVEADLSRPEGVRVVYDRVMEIGDGIDVLVNNAGFGWYGYASDMPADTAREMVQVNNEAMAQLIVMFLPIMRARGRGHVINVSSIVGGFPSPWAALYSATKSFIDAFTTALHRELRGTGVHVSAVRPGPVLTEFYQTVTRRSEGRSIPVGKSCIAPEVVANAIVGLLQRPRRVVYVPGRFRILPWVELGFGWVYDIVAELVLRRQSSHA
ncbi:MAG TPA: SDR family NAD(P)-dependent oxidoreductase, partial [Spirochaetia bacterium]